MCVPDLREKVQRIGRPGVQRVRSIVVALPDERLPVLYDRLLGLAILEDDEFEPTPRYIPVGLVVALVGRNGLQLKLNRPVTELSTDRFGLEP